MKRIREIGDCSCACHRGANDNYAASAEAKGTTDNDSGVGTRPSMSALHQMLQNHEWEGIQDAIQKDSSISMRIDDSLEEDLWFYEARRRKAVQMGIIAPSSSDTVPVASGAKDENTDNSMQDQGMHEDGGEMQLRYWVGSYANTNDTPNIKARREMQQKRTLLHTLCRMRFPSNEALVVQLTHGDSEGLQNLMGAVKTAQMLIDSSHNCLDDVSDCSNGDSKGSDGSNANDGYSHCNSCPCYFYRRYCPPVLLPPVERQQPEGSDQTETQTGSSDNKMIQHTSVLTMTDAMGETPLLSLTGAGSCHVDLVKVFIGACRLLGEEKVEEEGIRKPTIYDLLVARNYHGCTPVHFLAADCKNEEALRLLLEQCRFSDSTIDGRIHPTMVSDNEGDLPLHFAACNGAPPSLLSILTTLGDSRSATVRNSKDYLAIDDLIEWYVESLDDQRRHYTTNTNESGSEDDSIGSESSFESHDSVPGNESDQDEERSQSSNLHLSSYFGYLPLARGWECVESNLWEPMSVLIQAAATAILREMHFPNDNPQNTLKPLLPIHAAVIATKYSNFPALAVHASIVVSFKDKEDDSRLLDQDSHGYLPLHWACGAASCMMLEMNATAPKKDDAMRNYQGGPLSRFNTRALPITLIEYLLHCEPAAAHITTQEGQLPLHLLVKDTNSTCSENVLYNERVRADEVSVRRPWNDIRLLLKEHPASLGTPDPFSRLYPFMAASSLDSDGTCSEPQSGLLSLEHTYRLILEEPKYLK